MEALLDAVANEELADISSEDTVIIPTTQEEINILQTIYHSYLSGKSLRQIAKELNDRFGLTIRGCNWNCKSVRNILSNPAYISVLLGTLERTEHYYREDCMLKFS